MEPAIIVATLAGALGGVLVLGNRISALASLTTDSRPCWEKDDCTMRRENPAICQSCPIYQYRDVPVSAFMTEELNMPPLRNFQEPISHAA